ncbi:hypothetical protein SLA2020_047850 [Shorea laevis]
MKKLLDSMDADTEFLNLSLLDNINHCPLSHQFIEGLTSIGEGHINIDDILSDPTVVVPGPLVSDQFAHTVNMGVELIGFGPPGDPNVVSLAANSPPLQTANNGTNNVDQEDITANQDNNAAEADNSGMGADATFGSWYP